MAQKSFIVKYKGYNNVNYDNTQPPEFFNFFMRFELPPFVKFVPYIVNPDITAMNPSSQWYGINNHVYQDNQLSENDITDYSAGPFPLPILEKDDMFYITETAIYDVYEDDSVSFKECIPVLQAFATTTEGNAVTVLMPSYTTNKPLFFTVDGEVSQEETILVLPDDYKLEANAVFYTDATQSNTIDSFAPCKIGFVATGIPDQTAGFYCANAEGVDGYSISAGGGTLIAVRLHDIGKLKWTEVE